MEADKRKRRDADGKTDGKKKKAPESDGGESEDYEVEEFYAILRRIHVAVTYFEKGNGKGKLTANGSRLWSQPFELEAIEKGNGGEGRKDVEKSLGLGLDLNADPVDEPES